MTHNKFLRTLHGHKFTVFICQLLSSFCSMAELAEIPKWVTKLKSFLGISVSDVTQPFFASFLMPLDTFPMNFFFIPPPTIHSLRNYSSICNSTFNALKSDHALSFCIVPYENLMSFQCNFSLGDFFTKAFFKILLTFSFFLFYQQNTKLEVKISRKRFKKLRCKFKTCWSSSLSRFDVRRQESYIIKCNCFCHFQWENLVFF